MPEAFPETLKDKIFAILDQTHGDGMATENLTVIANMIEKMFITELRGAASVAEIITHLNFMQLRRANVQRLPLFKNARGQLAHSQPDGSDWTLPEWTNAIAGEVGEATNIAKKIRRGDMGEPDDVAYKQARKLLGKELADVVIYADITAFRAGVDLGETVRDKFNEVSTRVGVDIRL